MVRTNLQEFVGDVHVLSNLQVGSNLFANDLAANVLTIAGNVAAEYFIGDGGFLSNIATTLDDIISNPNGNSVSNTVVFISGQDPIANTAIVTYANVGISVSNTNPTGEYQLSIGSNIFVNTHASNVLTIIGSVGANTFIGDGGLLSNIATTLDAIIDQGNTVSNTIQLISGADVTSNTGLVTHKDVGISVSNTEPTGEFQFGVGSNLLVNVYSSNVLAIEGNVNAQKMTLGTITVTSAYGLNHVTAQGSVTGDTISLTNATTGLAVTSNATVGGNVTAETVITSANVEVGDRLKFASNVFVDDLRIADLAANLVTYDKTTGELMDSGGLFANKIAVVSVQPPSALSANTTTIAKHGTYTVTTSSLAANSNAWNAFDGDSAVEWLGSTTSDHVYNGGGYTYSGTSNLFAGNYIQTGVSSAGEWLAVEFPYKTTLRHMKLTPPTTYQQYPASANVYATNDSLTWTELTNWSGVNPGDQQSNVQTIIVNATESYKKYAMVVTKTNGSDTNTALAEWKLFTESFSIDGGKVEMATSAVMGGETTMDQHGPHSRDPKAVPLKKYPEIAFEKGKFDHNTTTNTFVQAGYTITSSGNYSDDVNSDYTVWRAFTGLINLFDPGWVSPFGSYTSGVANSTQSLTNIDNTTSTGGVSSRNGAWVKLELPTKIKLGRVDFYDRYDDIEGTATQFERVSEAFVYGGNSNSGPWYEIGKQSDATNIANYTDDNPASLTIDTTSYYKYYIIQPTQLAKTISYGSYGQLMFYGYEELATQGDTSVDTTFTSIMNTPQTTGANVYTDAKLSSDFTNHVTGPTPVGTAAVHDNTNKYWELNGTLTSNIAVEANTFLEGDAPHSLSMWFNSSNLEANVSNTCVFSISDQEKLDSVNLDLQSNTWHNLTYAYQGEGGSRVTYLDGRKVAEDQAEDTFGDYPPFAMTGYSQGGYVVSASSEATGSYPGPAHRAFDNNTSPDDPYRWVSASGTYNTDGSYGGSESHTDVDGNVEQGEWLKIELPHKLKVSYFEIAPYPTNGSQSWRNYAILGSNDDINWYQVQKVSGLVAGNGLTAGSVVPTGTYKNSAFKYFVFIWSNKAADINQEVAMGDLKLYGHRENDLVRLPDPTNVLKYPHITLDTSNGRGMYNNPAAKRGYEVTASTYGAGGREPVLAFDGDTSTLWYGGFFTDSGGAEGSSPNQFFLADGSGQTVTDASSTVHYGSWLTLELPHKLQVSSIKIRSTGNSNDARRRFKGGKLFGSNTHNPTSGTISGNYYQLGSRFDFATSSTDEATFTINATTAYKYITLLGDSCWYDGTNDEKHFYIHDYQIFGTGVDSVPIQIGGGNIDKVANFRVYDKFVGEDQALEIWDAQKDAFGRAKSSMTLHKGRLGIGTTEPEGRLAVADEPDADAYGLQEFPPKPLAANNTHIEGHGVFRASASSVHNSSYLVQSFRAFDHNIGSYHEPYYSDNPYGDQTGDGSYVGGDYTTNGYAGEWLQLQLPYKVKLSKFSLTPRIDWGGRAPKQGVILALNYTGNEWVVVHTHDDTGGVYGNGSGFNAGGVETRTFKVNGSNDGYYDTFRFVTTHIWTPTGSSGTPNIAEWRLFGTREQGQSVLHDGQLTLTKSLNVPRIGPALDADDTPRRDRLVVEYNTSTNPTFEGAVRDTSGRGNDGMFYGGASYDATEKALTFDAVTGTALESGILPLQGDASHSYSFWFNRKINGDDVLVSIATSPDVTNSASTMSNFYVTANGGGSWFHIQNDTTYPANTFTDGTWFHVVCIYKGGGASPTYKELYVNGIKITLSLSGHSTSGDPLNFTNPTLSLGGEHNGRSDYYFNGSISNFKLYDTALTAEEVKTLYDMGRNGSVANPQPLHIAAPLYSPGTVVQVEQAVKTDTQTTTSVSPIDVSGLGVTIRPKFSNSKILVSYQVNMGGNYHMFLRVFRTQNGVQTLVGTGDVVGLRPPATSYQSHLNVLDLRSMNMEFLDSANGTDAIEYKVQFWVAHEDYTAFINQSMTTANNAYYAFPSSSITVKEVCQ
jgi:hypothetical protein